MKLYLKVPGPEILNPDPAVEIPARTAREFSGMYPTPSDGNEIVVALCFKAGSPHKGTHLYLRNVGGKYYLTSKVGTAVWLEIYGVEVVDAG